MCNSVQTYIYVRHETKACRGGGVVSMFDCYAGGLPIESGIQQLLATKRSAGVTLEVNLRECIKHMPLPNANKAAYSEETSKEVQNRGISDPTKKTSVLKKF